MVERYQSLGSGDTRNHLYLVVEKLHEMVVVSGIKLDEHSVGSGGEMALHNLGYLLQFGHYIAVHGSSFKIHADIGTGGVAEALVIDKVSGAGDDAQIDHALYALMDCRAAHSAYGCDIL